MLVLEWVVYVYIMVFNVLLERGSLNCLYIGDVIIVFWVEVVDGDEVIVCVVENLFVMFIDLLIEE